jgi:hypothetical protein
MTRYKVVIDNGRDYSAALPEVYDTYEQAEAAGEDWLVQFQVDNGIDPDDDDPAGFDVVEVDKA